MDIGEPEKTRACLASRNRGARSLALEKRTADKPWLKARVKVRSAKEHIAGMMSRAGCGNHIDVMTTY